MYQTGDWVKIKYGEYMGGYGSVAAVNVDGSYKVLPYNSKNEPQAMLDIVESGITLIEPMRLDADGLRRFARAEIQYREVADKVFPMFNIKAEEEYRLRPEDIAEALRAINEYRDCLNRFKEWFWLIQNVFYDKLQIKERYKEDIFSDAPETEDELFSTVYSLTDGLYWKLEDRFVTREDTEKYIVKFEDEPNWNDGFLGTGIEETAYKAVCEDISSRVRTYEYNKDLPKDEWLFSVSQKRHIINMFEEDMDIRKAPMSVRKKYKEFVKDLYALGDAQAMKILAWGYYVGNSVYRQSFKQAEKYLLKLYEKNADPFAANSLGYIYYYGRVGKNGPDYEKAFRYFSYGALAGIDESIYKCGDMLIHGMGTQKNVDMGINLIVDGYKDTYDRFCDGEYSNKFADYALRMGNICLEKLIFGMGARDAYKFYLEADFAIKKRMETGQYFGDDVVLVKISDALRRVREEFKLDINRSVLKADFPLYISHFYDDHFPVKVSITKKGTSYHLTLSRFKLIPGIESQVLVSLPELSYVNLMSEISFRLEGMGVVKVPDDGDTFLSDGFAKNEKTDALEFYSGGECIAAVEAKWFVIDMTNEKMKHITAQKGTANEKIN